jgi:hypothetical protein
MFVCHAEGTEASLLLLKQMIKKTQLRVYCFINAIFLSLFHPLISFSLAIANCIQ